MIDWRSIPKIDAHVHLLPREVLDANPDAEDVFSQAREADLLENLDRDQINRAVVLPFNDPCLLSMDFTVEAVHRNLEAICASHPGRFVFFADVDIRNTPQESADACRRALQSPWCRGIKIHPANTGMAIDDPYLDPLLSMAEETGAPVAIHSDPNRLQRDACAPGQIGTVLDRHPKLIAIVCHLGAFQWQHAAKRNAYFDLSAFLPDYVRKRGMEACNQMLRAFPIDRLLFGTDWPCSRSCLPEEIYPRTLEILNQMDFTEEEIHQIAYGNAARLLWGES